MNGKDQTIIHGYAVFIIVFHISKYRSHFYSDMFRDEYIFYFTFYTYIYPTPFSFETWNIELE